MSPFVIAIDGPACSGKGTLARQLAAALDFQHLDTGLIYRAVTYSLIEKGENYTDPVAALRAAKALKVGMLSNPLLHSKEMGNPTSVVAAMPEVRKELFNFQRSFPKMPGAVLDGRDIGTVIFPDAAIKFYITAAPEARAERALARLRERGEEGGDYDKILREIVERDRRDSERTSSPMRPAEDAVILDTTFMSRDDVFNTVFLYCL